MAEGCARSVVTSIRGIKMRPGYLVDKTEAQDRVLAGARPLDLMAFSFKGQAAGQLGMGYFNHVSVFVGDETALRAAGVWNDPAVRPWQDTLRSGPMVIEAMRENVELAGREAIFNADSVAVLRPQTLSRGRRQAALRDLFAMIGTPFDFHFDARTPDAVFCTEVPARVMPELRLPLRELYGRPSYLPDETVARALQGKLPLRLVDFVLGGRNGWQGAGPQELAARILSYWPEDGGDE
ncbi:YiiX/YebB-like N1pC/P60 family cysteine hydrolase [Marimonas arenosa]|uniref:Uncharacterized protein n=1 Tax=Marimonas arenosa TaxID=1795305 RepID=A0AAE3W9H1_9RHOB|nr:YiiX/YebB-like N1pC/P60 family cysteine hydrolase [Marimonas arenosa]MDQ2089071.1 hypothetical protein [Marimonas arenosa]